MEEIAESLRIDRLTAEFYYFETEQDFRQYSHPGQIKDTRLATALAAVFYLAFAYADYLAMGAGSGYLVVLSLRLVVCAIGIGAALACQRYWQHLVSGLIPSIVVTSALAAYLVTTMLVPLPYGVHGMGMMAMLLGVYMFIPNRFILTLSLCVFSSILFIVMIAARFTIDLGSLPTLTAIVVVTNVVGAMTAYRLSRFMREEYRDRTILRRANQKLNVEMEERLRLEDALRRRAEVDEVTGAANRTALFEHAEAMLHRSNEGTQPLSLLLLDVDYFRQFHATYGHLRSDEVLKAVVTVAQSLLSGDQYLARLGGEEFIVLLPGFELPQAMSLAERIRAECQRTPVIMGDVTIHFTISIGVVQYRPNESIDVLFRRADDATAAAKYKGRNRVEAGI